MLPTPKCTRTYFFVWRNFFLLLFTNANLPLFFSIILSPGTGRAMLNKGTLINFHAQQHHVPVSSTILVPCTTTPLAKDSSDYTSLSRTYEKKWERSITSHCKCLTRSTLLWLCRWYKQLRTWFLLWLSCWSKEPVQEGILEGQERHHGQQTLRKVVCHTYYSQLAVHHMNCVSEMGIWWHLGDTNEATVWCEVGLLRRVQPNGVPQNLTASIIYNISLPKYLL